MPYFSRFLHILQTAVFTALIVFNTTSVVFADDTYECPDMFYLPANATACAPCPDGYTCDGGTYSFNAISDQGLDAYYYAFDYTCVDSINNNVGDNTSKPESGIIQYGQEFTLSADTCTTPVGYNFIGWRIYGTDEIIPAGKTLAYKYLQSTTFEAAYEEYPFKVKISSLNAGDAVSFSLAATGKFYVDCGDGGTLGSGSGIQSDGKTIISSNAYGSTYTCTYSTPGQKTIGFAGVATGYYSGTLIDGVSPIMFRGNKITAFEGNLSIIFPYYGSEASRHPRFYFACKNCHSLTSISSDLFKNYTRAAGGMFDNMFNSAIALTSLPEGLFANIRSIDDGYPFDHTFDGCNLTGTYIPASFFVGLVKANVPAYTFGYTFDHTYLATTCPAGTQAYADAAKYKSYWSGHPACTTVATVTYNCGIGGGNAPAAVNNVLKGTYFTPAVNTCTTPDGYTFDGWLVSDTDGKDIKTPGEEILWNYAGNRTLTAHYTPKRYRVKYNCDGINLDYVYIAYGTPFTAPNSSVCTAPTGYVFAGWLISNTDNTIKQSADEFTWEYPEHKVFTAQWEVMQNYAIHYELNDGEFPVLLTNIPESFTSSNLPLDLTNIVPTRSGYTFDGWYDNAEFTGNAITEIPSGSNTNITLYAKWIAETPLNPCTSGYVYNPLATLDSSVQGTLSGDIGSEGNHNASTFGLTDVGTFATSFSYGTVYGVALCSSTSGVVRQAGTPNENSSGHNCWCKTNGVKPVNGVLQTTTVTSWIYLDNLTLCDRNCALNCSNRLEMLAGDWRAAFFGSQTCVPEEYTITYTNNNNESDTMNYTVVDTVNLPLLSDTENARFAGWCINSETCETGVLQIPAGTTGNITLYAKWESNTCTNGQYLSNGVCNSCENGYTSDGATATSANDCYKNWECPANPVCPENSTCEYIDNSELSGTDYFGSETLHCEISMECVGGYTYNSGTNTCEPIVYSVGFIDGETSVDTLNCTENSILNMPTLNDSAEYVFVGWCKDLNDCDSPLTGKQSCPTDTAQFYAKWVHANCSNGEYLKDDQCITCPDGYTSNGATATNANHCYKNWSCNGNPECPEHSTSCGYVGATSGTEYYGSVIPHCNISFGCQNGYTPQNSILSNQNVSVNADRLGSINLAGNGGQNVTDLSVPGMWYTTFNYGKLSGRALCSAKSGADYHSFQWNGSNPGLTATEDELTSADGEARYCWCHANEFTPTNESLQNISTPWIMASDRSSASNCTSTCAQFCSYTVAGTAYAALGTESSPSFRTALYNSSSLINGTSRTYNAQNKTWSVTFPYGTASGVSLCSSTWADGYGSEWRVGHPDENTTGKNCWCKATNISTNDNSLQSMLTGYWVYSAFNSNNCERDCAESCADSIKTHRVVRSSSLRVWTDDNSCALNNYTLTFISDDSVYDTLNYTVNNTISLPVLNKHNSSFVGWCEGSADCENPLNGNQTGWFGNKTLYAKWDSSVSCGTNYHAQSNILAVMDYRSDGESSEHTSITGKVSVPSPATLSAGNWKTYFNTNDYNGAHGTVYGKAWCSTDSGTTKYEIVNDIDTGNNGANCWCQITGFTPANGTFTRIAAEYVYITEQSGVEPCKNTCAATCANQMQQQSLFRQSAYDSLAACAPNVYTVTYVVDNQTKTQDYTLMDTIDLPTPKKADYDFVGWCIDSADCATPATEPQTGWSGDKTLYAKWTPKTYSITYEHNDGYFVAPVVEPGSYTVDKQTVLPESTREGFAFSGWYDNVDLNGDAITALPTTKTGNITLYAKWRPESYQITYIDNGNQIVLPSVPTANNENESVVLPEPENAPEGQDFAGWCDDAELTQNCSTEKVISMYEPTTLYASWKPATYSIKYYDGSEEIKDSDLQDSYQYGDTVELQEPQKEHYDFVSWHSDNNLSAGSEISEISNTTSGEQELYAEYTATEYPLTFETNTDENITSTSYTVETVAETPLVLPALPVKSGRVSSGWFTNSNYRGSAISQLGGNLVGTTKLYANVSYPACGNGYKTQNSDIAVLDSTISAVGTANKGATATYATTLTDPETNENLLPEIITRGNSSNGKWGALFSYGTVYGEASCNYTTGTTPPTSLKYSESFDSTMSRLDNGTSCWCRMTHFTKTGESEVDTRQNTPWVYIKLYNDKDRCTERCASACANAIKPDPNDQFFRTQIFGPYSICAVDIYTIDYNLNGGNPVTELPTQYTIKYHDVTIPNDLTKEHYDFDKWCDESDVCAVAPIIRTGSYGNKTFNAEWNGKHYAISYMESDGTPLSATPTEYIYGETTNLNSAAKDYYNFVSWHKNSSLSDAVSQVSSTTYDNPLLLYAQWTPMEYNINYHNVYDSVWPNDTKPEKFTIESDSITIPTPIRDEYSLKGWCVGTTDNCTDDQLQKPYIVSAGTHSDVDLWARWEAATYDIYYKNMDDGSGIIGLTPDKYTFGERTYLPETLEDATRLHYYFDGWYATQTPEPNDENVLSVSDTDSGDKTFYAKWTPTPYKVTYYWDSDKTFDNIYDIVSYTVEDSDITPLPTPSKTHFRFDGWKDENDTSIDTIITANGGDRELYATWTRVSCENNYYLTDNECIACPVDYPYSDGQTARSVNDCYAMCPQTTPCPEEHSVDCVYNNNVENNINSYGSGLPCGITFTCDDAHYSVMNSTLAAKDTSVPGTGTTGYISADNSQSNNVNVYGLNNAGDWGTSFVYGNITGSSLCSDTSATNNTYYTNGTPSNTNGKNCWCKATGYTPVNENLQNVSGTTWVFNTEFADTNSCNASCANSCATNIGAVSDYLRKPMFAATCLPDVYTIQYFGDGQQINLEPKQYTYGYITSLPNAPKDYYHFVSWHTDSSLSVASVISEISATTTGNQTLYAKWTPFEFDIKFNHGVAGTRTTGFTGTMENQPVEYDATNISLDANQFGIDGYTFKDWSCSATNLSDETYTGTYSNIGTIDKYEYTSDMTCTAQWTANKYTLTYDCNGGVLSDDSSNTTKDVSVDYDSVFVLDNSICTRQDYTAENWVCDDVNLDTATKTWNILNNTKCTANWTEKQYNIIYKETDGTVLNSITPKTHTAFTQVTVPNETPVKEYFEFVGLCDEDGTNCETTKTVPVGTSDDVVFVVKWKRTSCPEGEKLTGDDPENLTCTPETYTIKYIVDGTEDTSLTPQSYVFGTSVNLPSITKDGRVFTGWCDGVKKCTTKLNGVQNGLIHDKVFYANWNEEIPALSCSAGYKVQSVALNTLIDLTNAGSAYNALGDVCFTETDNYDGDVCPGSNPVFNTMDKNDWRTTFDYGTIYGTSMCSTTLGSYADTGTPNAETGKNCWCKINGYKPNGESLRSVSDSGWIFNRTSPSCATHCPQFCAQYTMENSDFRTGLTASANVDSCVKLTQYTITYHNIRSTDWPSDSGHPVSYNEQDTFTIAVPERAGLTFVAWCEDANLQSNCTQTKQINLGSTGNKDFYAKWDCPVGYKLSDDKNNCELVIYEINYHDVEDAVCVNDCSNPPSYNIKSGTITIQDLARSNGDIFLGWCDTDKNCASPVKDGFTFDASRAADIDLYAIWEHQQEFECTSNKWLNIGGNKTCLSATKETSPAFALRKKNKNYYLQMTKQSPDSEGLKIHKDATKKLNVFYKGDIYNIHDGSVQ